MKIAIRPHSGYIRFLERKMDIWWFEDVIDYERNGYPVAGNMLTTKDAGLFSLIMVNLIGGENV